MEHKEIKVDEEVLNFAEQMVPLAYQIMYYYNKQQTLFDAFHNYCGGASEEMSQSSPELLKQLHTLVQGYLVLASNLNEIVESFASADKQLAQKYQLTVLNNMGKEVAGSVLGGQ